MAKAAFLDIDGTLCGFDGKVPDSAKEAIKAARERKNLVFLCTGRAKAEILPYIWEIGFDGMVASAGAYVEVDGKELFHKTIKPQALKRLVEFLKKNKVAYILETARGIFADEKSLLILKEIFEKIDADNSEEKLGYITKIPDSEGMVENVNKVLYFNCRMSFEEMNEMFKDDFLILPSSIEFLKHCSGEISIRDINKATGMRVVLEHLNLKREDSLAIGDSFNDIEMLRYAGTGIAVENAPEMVKEAANDITCTPEEGAIFQAFKKYGLI